MRVRIAFAAFTLLALAGFHLQPSLADNTPMPQAASHGAPVASYAPSAPDWHQPLIAALTKAQAQHEADVATWIAAAPKPRPRPARTARVPAPSAPVEAVAYDPGSIQALVCSIFGDACAKAIRVGGCESGLDPTARNRSGASGLFQIVLPMHKAKFEAHGWSADDWADPFKNATIAYEMSGGGVSWGPWSESRHCWG